MGTSYESTYRMMLAKSYHVGLDHYNHKTTLGRTIRRLVVLTPAMNEAGLLWSVRTRRFYGSDDWNAQVFVSEAS